MIRSVFTGCVVLLLGALQSGSLLFAQQMDFEGMWKGQLSQSNRSIMYDYVLKLYYETDSTVFGTSKIVRGDGSFAEFYIEGVYRGDQVKFTDVSLMKEMGASASWAWCFKNYIAEIKANGNKWTLSGDWDYQGVAFTPTGVAEGAFNCQPGKFFLNRVKGGPIFKEDAEERVRYFQGRLVDMQQTIEVDADSLTLYFIDDNQIDNDTISIFYNKDVLVKQHHLSHDSLQLTIPLHAGIDNLLIIYANNVGAIPPNTAALIFYVGEEKRQMSLASDPGRNAGVIFRRKR